MGEDEPTIKALVYWINDILTGIVDKDDFVIPEHFAEGKKALVMWKSKGDVERIRQAKVVRIGNLQDLELKQAELDKDLEKIKAQLEDVVQTHIARPKALVYWISEELTSIVDKEDFENGDDFLENRVAMVKWKSEENKDIIHEARVIKIGELQVLELKQAELNKELEAAKAQELEDANIKRQRKTPTYFDDYELSSDSESEKEKCEEKIINPNEVSMQEDSVDSYEDCSVISDNVDCTEIEGSFINGGISGTEKSLEDLHRENLEKEGVIRTLERVLHSMKEETCMSCRVFSNGGPQNEAFLQSILEACSFKNAEPVNMSVVPSVQQDDNCLELSRQRMMSVLPSVQRDDDCLEMSRQKMVEVYPGSDVWISNQAKTLAILKANGRPTKLVSSLLRALYSREQLARFSMYGQRINTGIPAKEANAIKELVLSLFKRNDGKPALKDTQFSKWFNRTFALARVNRKGKKDK